MTSPPALVVGAARCVWDDLRAARPYVHDAAVFAVNYMVLWLPHVDHAVSHHAAGLGLLVQVRKTGASQAVQHAPLTTHAPVEAPGIDRVWPRAWKVGDSGLLAVRIALALGHDRVVLAGVPIDATPSLYLDPELRDPYGHHGIYRDLWRAFAPEFRGHVTSMSGWTRELLGAPDGAP